MQSALPLFGLVVCSILSTPGLTRAQDPPVSRESPYVARYVASQEYREALEEEVRQRKRAERLNEERERRYWSAECPGCARREEGIQVRAVPGTGVVGVLHDVDLEEEFLMVRLRFYNDGAEQARLTIDPVGAYESYFVEVGGEKRHILRNEDGELEAKKPLAVEMRPGAMESWWARFPAIPGTESFDVVIPPAGPFLSVPKQAD